MKKTLIEKIAKQFKNFSEAAQLMGITRRTLYKIMDENKVGTRAYNKIEAAGINPITFKRIRP